MPNIADLGTLLDDRPLKEGSLRAAAKVWKLLYSAEKSNWKILFWTPPYLYRCRISRGVHFWAFQNDPNTSWWFKFEKTQIIIFLKNPRFDGYGRYFFVTPKNYLIFKRPRIWTFQNEIWFQKKSHQKILKIKKVIANIRNLKKKGFFLRNPLLWDLLL